MDSFRIKITGDDSDLKKINDTLSQTGKIDAQNTANFVKNQKTVQAEALKTANGFKNVADATKGVFANDSIDRINKATVQLGGLRNSINQLTRELPAFTFSAQTGFMAISNNIPILIDEIGRLKKANLDLAASGQPTTSVFKALASSFFSLGTLMSVGITLLTVYGKEIGNLVAGLFGATKESENYTKAVAEINKELKKQVDLEIELQKARGNNTEALEREKFTKAYKESVGAIASAESSISELKKNTAKQESIINSNRSEEVKNIAIEQIEANKKTLVDLEKTLELKQTKSASAEYELRTFEATISKKKVDEAKKADKDITDSHKAVKDNSAQLAEQEWQATLKELKALESIQVNYDKRMDEINQVNTKRQIQTMDDGLQKELELFQLNADAEIKIAASKGEDLTILEELQAKQRQDIKDKYNAKERAEYEKLLKFESDAREKQVDEEMALLEEKARKQEELQKATQQAIESSLTTLFNTASTLNKQEIDESAQRQIEALDSEKSRRLNNKRLTDQQRILLEKEYADKVRQIQKRAFEEKKKQDIALAIINTAVGIVKTFATLGYPLGIPAAAALAVQGAAEVAIIQKQKFEKGGLVKGKRHSDGGVHIEVEGEEFITNRNQTSKHLNLLKAINDGKAESFIYKKFVLPAIVDSKMASQKESQSFSNLAEMLALNSIGTYDDLDLRRTIKETSQQSAKYIAKELKQPSRTNSRYF